MSKLTAFKLALCSALLGVSFGLWHEYVCCGAALLLMLIFDGIWAAKVHRDYRLSKWHDRDEPKPPLVKTSTNSTHLSVPSTD